MKTVESFFKDVFHYAANMENYVHKAYPRQYTFEYTFPYDFAIADWCDGVSGVKDTYRRVKRDWLKNPKAWAEVVISLSYLIMGNYSLMQHGFAGRNTLISLYSDLFLQAKEDFYKAYPDASSDARCLFFEMTD